MKRVNDDMRHDDNIRSKANNYLQLDQPYGGETEVVHYLEMLRDDVGFDTISKKVVKPIGRKVGAYYGCLLLRPGKVMAFDNGRAFEIDGRPTDKVPDEKRVLRSVHFF